MLVACRLAGLSALEADYVGLVALRQTERNYAASRVHTILGYQ
jgi:hypothetical protein